MKTQFPKHITTVPYGDNIALWNNRTGCCVVISKPTFEDGLGSISPALQYRLQKMHFLHKDISNMETKIPHRNRNCILVDDELWSPNPQKHHSGGYAYYCTKLTPQQLNLFKKIDGQQSIQDLSSTFNISPTYLYELLLPWMSIDRQVVQIRDRKLGTHHPVLLQMISPRRSKHERKEHMHDESGTTNLHTFHQSDIQDARHHFDDVEITLAHALELPHPCLNNLSFGVSLTKCLLEKLLNPPNIVVELGAGSGAVTEGFFSVYQPSRYIRMDASPVLLKHQQKRVPQSESLNVKAPPIPFENNSIDLFLCNEVIADLPSSPKESLQAQKLLQKYNINIPKEQRFVNTGSWELIESLHSVLHKNGLAYISEFGSLDEIPEETTHLNHPEMSIHFGQLEEVAKKIGFHTILVPIEKLLNMSLDELWMSKHSFMALRACYANKSLHLQARAYHPSTFVSRFDIHGLEWNSMYEVGPAPLPQRVWALLLWKEDDAKN
jgi:hypothetical protein